jgi:Flp pilus assembly protein protease CpaA
LGQGQLHTVEVVVWQVPLGQSAAAAAAVNDTIKKTTSNRLSVFFILLIVSFTILIHSKILSYLIEI